MKAIVVTKDANSMSKYTFDFENYLKHSEQNAFNHRVENSMEINGERLSLKVRDNFGSVKTIASSEQSERQRVVYNNVYVETPYKLTDKYSASAIYQNNLFRYNSVSGKIYPTFMIEFH